MKNKILIMSLVIVFNALLIIGIYYNTEDSMGNYLIQIFIALAFAAIIEFSRIIIFYQKKSNFNLFLVAFIIMLIATEIGKWTRFYQDKHIIYQDFRGFETLYYGGKKAIEINSDKIGSVWFLKEDETTFILFDGTKIECLKNECNIVENKEKNATYKRTNS